MNAARSRPDWLATVQSDRKQAQSRVCTPGIIKQLFTMKLFCASLFVVTNSIDIDETV